MTVIDIHRGRAVRDVRPYRRSARGLRRPEVSEASGPWSIPPSATGLRLVHVGEHCDCPDCTSVPGPVEEMFGYTIGLAGHEAPELLVRGLDVAETAQVLNSWGDLAAEGETYAEGDLLCSGPGEQRWELHAVADPWAALPWAQQFYRRPSYDPVPALELVPTRRRCRCERH